MKVKEEESRNEGESREKMARRRRGATQVKCPPPAKLLLLLPGFYR